MSCVCVRVCVCIYYIQVKCDVIEKLHSVRAMGDIKQFSFQSVACRLAVASAETYHDRGSKPPYSLH